MQILHVGWLTVMLWCAVQSAAVNSEGLNVMPISDAFKRWYGVGKTFNFNEHRIFYKDEGFGEVILCLHGFPTASWDWVKIWPDLTQMGRVVATDMLGFGYSDKPYAHTYSIMEQADMHEALLNDLGIERVHILAHDYGDTVSQELIARHNAGTLSFEVVTLCLLNGGLFPETHHPRRIQSLLLTPIIGTVIAMFFNRRAFARSFPPIFGVQTQPTDDELDEFWQLIAKNDGNRLANKLLHYIPERVTHRERWVAALQETDVPLKLINGLDDPVSGGHMVKRYTELIPNPDVKALAGIGHYPQVEAPEQVLNTYREFVEPYFAGE